VDEDQEEVGLAFRPQKVGDVILSNEATLVLISGPCVIESEGHALDTAGQLKEMCEHADIQLIYKSSYDKGNRSSLCAYRGPGIEKGLAILQKVKETYAVPLLSDIHCPEEAKAVATVCDVLQIPAFLCRQTDLLVAASQTGALVNIKKGQFMSPWEMGCAAEKIIATGNRRILLTERGTTFGYHNLVCDMRTIPIMQKLGFPVCFDASHAVQLPGGMRNRSGGEREFIPTLAKAALAAGADLLYIESHECPERAKSDRDSVMPFEDLKAFLPIAKSLYECIRLKPCLNKNLS